MIVKTLFQHEGRFACGEVEIKLLPGIPILHVVGLPDAHIRECGIKLKSALRSSGLHWPQGHQIVVNLRPSYFRKSSSGVDLAVALGFLALTEQLPESVASKLSDHVVYGELALDGRVIAPFDLPSALRAAEAPVITGLASPRIRDGEWWQIETLAQKELTHVARLFCWDEFWREPKLPEMELHPLAAEALLLAAHLDLNVLVAGPQGSGKSTWAKLLYALTSSPDPGKMCELQDLFGESVLESGWRPFEKPHHSITSLAMIGGGSPLFPGVISRAHGGVLVMDEFLEFPSPVLEALREPLENGFVEIARKGDRAKFPAQFQLIGTTNLCPCGKLDLNPQKNRACQRGLFRCRSVCERLSGPLMDRFDYLLFSHEWLGRFQERVPCSEVKRRLTELRQFAVLRGETPTEMPEWIRMLGHSHRRNTAVLRVARGLADLGHSVTVEPEHYGLAYDKVVRPMDRIAQLFA